MALVSNIKPYNKLSDRCESPGNDVIVYKNPPCLQKWRLCQYVVVTTKALFLCCMTFDGKKRMMIGVIAYTKVPPSGECRGQRAERHVICKAPS